MLKAILQELAAAGGYSYAHLAQRLDIDEGLLAQMMEDLARRGYLAPLSPAESCSSCSSCSGCGLHKACSGGESNTMTAPKGWVLTAKGRRVAQS